MEGNYPIYPRESAARQQAYIEIQLAVRRIQVLAGRRLPSTTPTLGDVFAALRQRGDDVVFTSENPGP